MTASLRVALVTPRFAPDLGGLETHVGELAQHLGAAGAEVEVLTQASAATVVAAGSDSCDKGYRVRRFALPLSAAPDLPAPGLVSALISHGRHFDVVHAHSYHQLPALLAGLTAGRCPLVFTPHYHGTGHTPLRAALHRIYRPVGHLLVRRADALVAVSVAEARLLTADFGRSAAAKVTVIPNGVRREPAAAPFDIRGRVVLAVGRLEPYKGTDLLISAVPHLPDDVRLLVVGDGPARRVLAAQAAALGIADRLILAGRIGDDELARWRATASVFASASAHEAFGLTLADALVSGLPAVVSAIPAHREVVALAGPGARGLLVEGKDPETYAAQISAALNLPTAVGPCSLPDWAEVAGRTLALYERLVTAPGSVRRAVTPLVRTEGWSE